MSESEIEVRNVGYWNAFRMSIWAAMTPVDRDYDRYQGKYPPGQGQCETAAGRLVIEQRDEDREGSQDCCSCHINPPCQFCVDGAIEKEV